MTNQGFSIDTGDMDVAPPEPQEATAAPARRRPGRPARAPAREPAREAPRDGVILSRAGEVLTRRRRDGVDPFHIPSDLVPEGWSYQWNVISVVGNTDVVMDQGMGMYENGWRPVPAERHPGMFVPRGTTGAIIRGGLRLEERPESLTLEAKQEQEYTAKRLMIDQSESVMGRMNKSLQNGYAPPSARQQRSFKTGGDNIKMSIDKALDIPAPGNYQLADDSAA